MAEFSETVLIDTVATHIFWRVVCVMDEPSF